MSDRPTRDCQCKRANHQHGTNAAYTRDGGLRPGWTARVYAGPWRTISCGFPTREAALTWATRRVQDERVWDTRWTGGAA